MSSRGGTMLTNAFRIGGFQHVSWFQLLPLEVDDNQSLDKRSKRSSAHFPFGDNKVLTAHIRLQNEGHLSAWTSDLMSSVEDDALKLWLFLPGHHENINTAVQPMVSGLKVVGNGFWCLPGDCDDVTFALCQALRNRIERALWSVGYVRFGDVFVKCRSLGTIESHLRKPLPACEVIFTASQEAIFAQFIVQRKRVRTLSAEDIHATLGLHANKSRTVEDKLPVVVAPHGLCGELSGCCSEDLVNELYKSLPAHMLSPSYHGNGTIRGFYAEVYLGHHQQSTSVSPQATGSNISASNIFEHNLGRSVSITCDREEGIPLKYNQGIERVLIFPIGAVLVPLLLSIPARTYLRRCWFQNWAATSWLEDVSHAGLTVASSSSSWDNVSEVPNDDKLDNFAAGANGLHEVKSISSKSSGSSSSGGSSTKSSSTQGSSSSSDSDIGAMVGSGELETDADSVVTKATVAVSSTLALRHLGHVADEKLDGIKSLEDATISSKRGRTLSAASQHEAPTAKVARFGNALGEELSSDGLNLAHNRDELNMPTIGISCSLATGTPKAGSSQVGTPWDWSEDDRGLRMDMQNDAEILAEFGDFGDFFEDDGLDFLVEPPGTADSQALMFSLVDHVEGTSSPGNACIDFSDPMLLPILDIPALEGFGQQPASVKEEKLQGNKALLKDVQECVKSPVGPICSDEAQMPATESLPKSEAVMLFAPGYDPVSIPNGQATFQNLSMLKSPYVPTLRKSQAVGLGSESYVYSATPPSLPKAEDLENLKEYYDNVSSIEHINTDRVKNLNGQADLVVHMNGEAFSGPEKIVTEKIRLHELRMTAWSGLGSLSSGNTVYAQKKLSSSTFTLGRSLTPILATDFECFMLQLTLMEHRDNWIYKAPSPQLLGRTAMGAGKERSSDGMQAADSSTSFGKWNGRQQQDRKKKDRIPSRIAGDADEELQDGTRAAQVGVWRPVGAPKTMKAANAGWNENSRLGLLPTSLDAGSLQTEESSTNMKESQWQEILDAIPLLVQQSAVSFDVVLDGECGDGPFGWLMHQEQQRRKSVCGPGVRHAGCGGMLAACHFIDSAGVELLDPLVGEVSAASVTSLLQTDVRMAVGTAFGDANVDGPLSLADWCRGRVLMIDGLIGDGLPSDSKETASTVTVAVGEPITPPQCTSGLASGLKVSGQDIENQVCDVQRNGGSWNMEVLPLSDDSYPRRPSQESDVEMQSSNCCRPTILALPMPCLLVGYQDDWLKTSSSTLHFWEMAPLEPYSLAKPVTYTVVCPRIDSLLCAASSYIRQLGAMYEVCKLGTHLPVATVPGQAVPSPSTGKRMPPGFVTIDYPSHLSQASSGLNPLGSMSSYVMAMEKTWNMSDYCKALQRICKSLPISTSPASHRDPENCPCLVYYVICPSSEPTAVLQTIMVASQSIGSCIAVSDRERRAAIYCQMQRGMGSVEDSLSTSIPSIMGFSTSKLVLQVLTAETVFKASSPPATESDSLKEMAFTIYNKIRRIPRCTSAIDCSQQSVEPGRSRIISSQTSTPITGMWKDCGANRNCGVSMPLLAQDTRLDSGSFRTNSWENSWQQPATVMADTGTSTGGDGHDYIRYLFEPLFILAEPGMPDQGAGISLFHTRGFEESVGIGAAGLSETMSTSAGEAADFDVANGGNQKTVTFHCSYGWTEDWHWLVSVWTDARGELLDVHLFPTTIVRGCYDAKGLHVLFVQVLQHGCQLLAMAAGIGAARPRNVFISRLGAFYELELQEWQKAVFIVGGTEVRKWPVQLWQLASECTVPGINTSSFRTQDITIADRALGLVSGGPSSPGPPSSVFSLRGKSSSFAKAEPGPMAARKQGSVQLSAENWKGVFQSIQSVSFVNVSLDHSLQLAGGPNDMTSHSGLGLVKTLAATSASYLIIPGHSLRYMSSLPLQLPIHITPELPPLAQLLYRKGCVPAIASAFVVSRAIPSLRTHFVQQNVKEDWPSTLYIGLVGYMGNSTNANMQQGAGTTSGSDMMTKVKARSIQNENREQAAEAHYVLELVAAELQALSWLTVSPRFPFRRTALPFHCDLMQRLCRIINYADNELSLSTGLQEHQQGCL